MLEQLRRAAQEVEPTIGQILSKVEKPVMDALSSVLPQEEAQEVVGKGEVADPKYVPKPSQYPSEESEYTNKETTLLGEPREKVYPFTASYTDNKESIKDATGRIKGLELEDKATVLASPVEGREALAKNLARARDNDTLADRKLLSKASNEVYVQEALANKAITREDIWVLPFLAYMHEIESNYAVEKTHKGAEGGSNNETSSYGVLMKKFPLKEGETMLSQAARYAVKNILPHFKDKKGNYLNPDMSKEERDVRSSLMWNKGGKTYAHLSIPVVKNRLLSYIVAGDEKGITKKKDDGTDTGTPYGVNIGIIHRNAKNYNKLIEATTEGDDSSILYYELTKKIKEGKIVGTVITYTFDTDPVSKKVINKPYRVHTKNLKGGVTKYYKGEWTPEGVRYAS